MNVERLLGYYKHGHLSMFEFFVELGQIISAANVHSVLSSLPSDVLDKLRDWVLPMTVPSVTIVGGELSREEAEAKAANLHRAIPLIQAWFSNQRQ